MAFGLLKGAYWVVLTPSWSAIDEAAHFGYVESLARGHGIPTVGKDLVTDRELESIKVVPTSPYRYHPYTPTTENVYWGATAHQYEAIHGPTYYAVMVPAYWIGAPFGIAGSLYAVRAASVVLGVLAIPLVWMLARRLFPDRPSVWILAPAVMVVLDSTFPGSVGNEPMVLTLGTASMVLLLRSLDNPRRWSAAVLFGIAAAATIVTKTTSLALIPMSAILVVAWLVVRRPGWSIALRWIATVGAAALLTTVPWLAWNYHAYRAPSASKQVEVLTGGLQAAPEPLSLDVLNRQFLGARNSGVWSNQGANNTRYTHFWEWVLVGTAASGLVVSLARRRWRDLGSFVWCASALPLAFLTLEAIVWIVFGGGGGPAGRHLVIALGPTAVMIAAGCITPLGERWGSVVVTAGLAWSMLIAVPIYNRYIETWYLGMQREGGVAPVLHQTLSDMVTPMGPIRLDTTCPVQAIGIGFEGQDIPTEILVTDAGGREIRGDLDETTHGTEYLVRQFVPTFQLEEPVTGTITVTTPGQPGVNGVAGDIASWVSMDGAVSDGAVFDPLTVVFCQTSDPDEVTFDSVYPVLHPGWVTLGWLRGIPIVFAVIGVAGAVTTLGWAIVGSVGDVRRRR